MKIPILLTLILTMPSLPLAGQESEAKKCDWEVGACVKYMLETFRNKGWIGIELEYDDSGEATILRVLKASPAEAAGLLPGDRLVAFDGVAYSEASEDELREVKKALVPGAEVRLTVRRQGEEMAIDVVAGEIPRAVLAQWVGSHVLDQHQHQFAATETD